MGVGGTGRASAVSPSNCGNVCLKGDIRVRASGRRKRRSRCARTHGTEGSTGSQGPKAETCWLGLIRTQWVSVAGMREQSQKTREFTGRARGY